MRTRPQLPLGRREDMLIDALADLDNTHVELVPSFYQGKADFHEKVIEGGGEGTVWKRLDQPYQPDGESGTGSSENGLYSSKPS